MFDYNKMSKEIYIANKQARLDEIAAAGTLPSKYDDVKNRIINHNNELIKMLDRKIAAAEALEAKLADSEYNSLKKYGENFSIEDLREFKAIDDDSELTDEQKTLLITCKGGKCQHQ